VRIIVATFSPTALYLLQNFVFSQQFQTGSDGPDSYLEQFPAQFGAWNITAFPGIGGGQSRQATAIFPASLEKTKGYGCRTSAA
jgi:hypothetical protein